MRVALNPGVCAGLADKRTIPRAKGVLRQTSRELNGALMA